MDKSKIKTLRKKKEEIFAGGHISKYTISFLAIEGRKIISQCGEWYNIT